MPDFNRVFLRTPEDRAKARVGSLTHNDYIGSAIEIDDHLNCGRNMNTKSLAPACAHVV